MKGFLTMKETMAKLVAKLALNTAISACGAASNWNTYQPKEPAALKQMAK